MADVVYSVEVVYASKGSLFGGLNASKGALTGSVRDLEKSMSKSMQGIGKTLGDELNSAFTTFFALSALKSLAGAGMEFMKAGLVGMNAEMEQMGITMAMMFSAHGNVSNFSNGLEASKTLIAKMRQDARELPGEFKDLSLIMSRMTTPALNAGLSIRDTEHLAANAMAVGVGGGMQADIVGREMGALIQGQMRKQMPILKILPNFNMGSSEFNALSMEKRVAYLKERLGMVEGTKEAESIKAMRDAFKNSWTGVTSTLKDLFKQVAGHATEPLFGRMKAAMGALGDYMSDHMETITAKALKFGDYLARGFSVALRHGAQLALLIERMGHFLAREADQGKLLSDLGKVAGVAGALKAGSMIAPVAAKYAPQIMGVGGEALAGIGGVLGASGAAASLGGLVVVLGAVAAAATVVYGAFSALSNEGSPLNGVATETFAGITQALKGTVYELAEAFKTAWPALKRIAEIMGTALLVNLEIFANVLETIAGAINSAVQAIAGMWDRLKEMIAKAFPFAKEFGWLDPDAKAKRNRDMEDEHVRRRFHPDDLDTKVKTPPNHTTHIHNVEIKVVANQDPLRNAKKTADVLLDLKRNPKVALLSGQPPVIR